MKRSGFGLALLWCIGATGCAAPEELKLDLGTAERIMEYPPEAIDVDPSVHVGLEFVRFYGASSSGKGPLYRPSRVEGERRRTGSTS